MFVNTEVKMDKQAYIISQAWIQNPFLVIPPNTAASVSASAHKKCQCCKKVKFTVEFPDYENEQLLDGKLPVCTKCFKMANNAGRRIVELTGIEYMCKVCGVLQTLDRYSYAKPKNTLKTACVTCSRKTFRGFK